MEIKQLTKKRVSHRKGKIGIYSQETLKRMSEAAKKRFENKENHPRYGKHHTEETKEKIRIAHLGKYCPPEIAERLRTAYCGKNNGMYGKHHTKEALEKMSKTFFRKGNIPYTKGIPRPKETRLKIRFALLGEKSPCWQGGISFEPYTPEFNRQLKELIRQRDGYQCQLCGMPEIENIRKLDIHHIDYVKKNCLPDNLITLCRSCNGKVNNNREKWIKYFHDYIGRSNA